MVAKSGESAASLLFELATEEIPSAYQKNLVADWEKRLPQLLKTTGLAYQSATVYGTARRIAFVTQGIAERGEDSTETLQGPAKNVALGADGKPTPALIGFAKKAGIAPEAVEFRDNGKGEYATATVTHKGKSLREAMPKLLGELVAQFKFPRSMRWGDLPTVYARPVAGYYLQYGKSPWNLNAEETKGTILEHLPFRPVRGHFILDKEPLQLNDAAEYVAALAAKKILVPQKDRREKIATLLNDAAKKENLSLIENPALLDEVNFLVERPEIVVGSFSADYLRLPDGVILSEMNQHQRYFGLRDANNKLSNKFLIVANADTASATATENIRSGNERVLRARLSDGAFFFDEDLKRPLADRVKDLKQIVFHDGLGTYLEKAGRLARLANLFAHGKVKADVIERAAQLVKADLTTALVYEFDHLQGEIGAVYATRSGEAAEVAAAIEEHYLPRFQGDKLPASSLGALMSLADKWDNILAAFILGKEPTASQDPFAIRRQTLYFIQILVAQKISVPLKEIIAESLKISAGDLDKTVAAKFDAKATQDKILDFVKGRLATIFENEGFDKKLTRAAIFSGSDDAFDLFARATALRQIAEQDRTNFDALLSAFKRMANIEAGGDKAAPDPKIFSEPAEKKLYELAEKLHDLAAKKSGDPMEHYRGIFAQFAAGKATVDDFFNTVMVNHDDTKIRTNRLALIGFTLAAVRSLIDLEQLS